MYKRPRFTPHPMSVPLCLAIAVGAGTAQAQTFVVTKTTDSMDGACDTDCSLREAVIAANASAGTDTIVLGVQTYTLTLPAGRDEERDTVDEDENLNGDLDVHDSLNVIGAGRDATIISGSLESHDRIFEVFAGATMTLRSLRMVDGHTSNQGAAIENKGETVLHDVLLFRNRASAAYQEGQGGGIANRGVLKVYSSMFSANVSSAGEGSAGRGGAILNYGTLLVRDTQFRGNTAWDDSDVGEGGAIYNAGTADIGRTTFVGNSANDGAAIRNDSGGTMKVFNSTFSASRMYYYNNATIVNGSFFVTPTPLASLQLVNVTISESTGGYGLVNYAAVLIRNSLIAGNKGEEPGSYRECENRGELSVYKAVGLLLGSSAGSGNCTGDVTVDSASVLSTVLYPLADNNGFTPTYALRRNSPALDAGRGSCAATDQRGLKRPRDGNGDGLAVCDLGAYERAYP